MALFGEFHVPPAEFTFHETFRTEPELVIEVERVVAAQELLSPYFWVSGVEPEDFEAAARTDPTVDRVHRLDDFEEATLYRATWTRQIDTLIFAYTHLGVIILDAKGRNREWILRMQFDGREELNEFTEYLNSDDATFQLQRLYEISQPRTGGQFGLTPKQIETLRTAWEMGYFELPRTATMAEVAEELDIAPQSVSDRLRRAQDTLIEEALRVEMETEREESGDAAG